MWRYDLTRRDFLARLCRAGSAIAALTTFPRLASGQTTKALLQASDLVYLGTFLYPQSGFAGDASYARGLTLRSVGGVLHGFTVPWNTTGAIEFVIPSTFSGQPQATLVKSWSDVTGGKMITGNAGQGRLTGLFWDELSQQLYWSYADDYNSGHQDPVFGISTLADNGGVTATGPFSFAGPSCKITNKGVLAIPNWFADSYLGGARLAAGFGSYQSVASSGPASVGPALVAFSPPSSQTALSGTILANYPFKTDATDLSGRAHRDTNYTTEFAGQPNPSNGIGYWTWTDSLQQSGIWIDTPTKSGVLFFAILGTGRTWYETSTGHAASGEHMVFEYAPADLARVALGQAAPSSLQAAATWPIQYPGLTYPLGGWQDYPPNEVTGVAFDAPTQRLFVAVRYGGGAGRTGIYVYRVSGGQSSTAPVAPSNLRITP